MYHPGSPPPPPFQSYPLQHESLTPFSKRSLNEASTVSVSESRQQVLPVETWLQICQLPLQDSCISTVLASWLLFAFTALKTEIVLFVCFKSDFPIFLDWILVIHKLCQQCLSEFFRETEFLIFIYYCEELTHVIMEAEKPMTCCLQTRDLGRLVVKFQSESKDPRITGDKGINLNPRAREELNTISHTYFSCGWPYMPKLFRQGISGLFHFRLAKMT